jgi:mRNA-degrading endonuclease toxin of MazEF toxin-antitoxin module
VPGNILLEPGEANLPRQSVVNISQIFTVDKTETKKRRPSGRRGSHLVFSGGGKMFSSQY